MVSIDSNVTRVDVFPVQVLELFDQEEHNMYSIPNIYHLHIPKEEDFIQVNNFNT